MSTIKILLFFISSYLLLNNLNAKIISGKKQTNKLQEFKEKSNSQSSFSLESLEMNSELRASWKKIDFGSVLNQNEDEVSNDFQIFLDQNELDNSSEEIFDNARNFFENYRDEDSNLNGEEKFQVGGHALLGMINNQEKINNLSIQSSQNHFVQASEESKPPKISSISECDQKLVEIINGPHKEAGKGAFGRIFIPENGETSVVIKEMEVGMQRENIIQREILISLMFRNTPNVVSYYKACYIDKKLSETKIKRFYYLFMEKCQQDFGDWFFEKTPQNDPLTLLKIIGAITNGYKHIHEKDILHLDNHIGNYMICNNKIKIMDFGIAKKRSTLSKMRVKITENLEFNELYNFFKTLTSYAKVNEKNINDLLSKLRRDNFSESSFDNIEDFESELKNLYFSFKLNVVNMVFEENSNQVYNVLNMIMVVFLLIWHSK